MGQFENTMTFVRSLKGAPASVLWALTFNRQMMTALELSQWTGYKGDNITVAVRLLVDLGWVVARSARGPWALVAGRQLPLMEVFEALEKPESDLIGFGNPDSDLIGVRGVVLSSSSSNAFPCSYLEEQQEEGDESDLNGVSPSELVDFHGNLKALDAAGIREPKRSKLAHMKHVTPKLIEAHVRQVKEEHMPLGTAIYRIEFGWSVDPRYEHEVVKYSMNCPKCGHFTCVCDDE
jgi:hypothetical protein